MIQIYDVKNLCLLDHRKGADFYLFILSANIEQHRKQDSYCDYIRISQIHIAGRNINLVHKVALCFEFKNKQKI